MREQRIGSTLLRRQSDLPAETPGTAGGNLDGTRAESGRKLDGIRWKAGRNLHFFAGMQFGSRILPSRACAPCSRGWSSLMGFPRGRRLGGVLEPVSAPSTEREPRRVRPPSAAVSTTCLDRGASTEALPDPVAYLQPRCAVPMVARLPDPLVQIRCTAAGAVVAAGAELVPATPCHAACDC